MKFDNIKFDKIKILFGDCFIVGLIVAFVVSISALAGFSNHLYIYGASAYLSLICALCCCAYWTKKNTLLHISQVALILWLIKFFGYVPFIFTHFESSWILIGWNSLFYGVSWLIAAAFTKFVLKKT
jgi:hypothetical protein